MHIVTSDKMHGIENKTDMNDGISENEITSGLESIGDSGRN